MSRETSNHKGFTLIELLIVVAIIGILAAIAIPNFLMAQVRAKVSRAQAEMHSLGSAATLYRIDNNEYPLSAVDRECVSTGWDPRFAYYVQLSTPVAYITNGFLIDPFGGDSQGVASGLAWDLRLFYDYRRVILQDRPAGATLLEYATGYNIDPGGQPGGWLFYSPGPDHWQNINSLHDAKGNFVGGFTYPLNSWPYYDPSNGTVSVGDILMSSYGTENSALASR